MALISLSTIGYTATKHLCGGKVVLTAISYTQPNLSCGMKKKKASCPMHKKAATPCCTNDHQLNLLESNFNHDVLFVGLNIDPAVMVNVDAYLFFSILLKSGVKIPNKSPPDLIFDRTIWYGNMLI